MLEEGHPAAELAQLYLCSPETIRRIGRRETWWWLKDEVEIPIAAVLPSDPTRDAAAAASLERLRKMLDKK